MTAIYAVSDAPALGPGAKKYVVECPQGRTIGHAVNVEAVGEAAILEQLLLRHDAEEVCGCTRELWKRVRLAKLLAGRVN